MHVETSPSTPLVRVLSGLSLSCDGRRIPIPPGSRRLLAFLALHPDGVDRRVAAGVLWPDVEDCRAAGNLRSALWRLQQVGCPLVSAEQSWLGLNEDVEVDLARLEAWATRVLAHTPAPGDLGVDPGPIADLELLPGWYDDWVLTVRERLQLRLLHALEALSRLLRRAGRPAAAVEAMHVAVLAEPLRESGQLALIEAHQAAGDWLAARRQYDAFRSILRREIGVEPSPELTAVARGTGRR
ncbi:BTAD domain-containing putative transcriptional regulator [Blastococcus sp. CT_GayMR16]|uniref:AfsR/SARP family transcriptional regulator n=1 Tax=Blastococcus sp. CT_GayMR16 TaxID=2559607 RepID=UPI00107469B0|nr:BTAD domain-containing putative transcriptional regulator [Blastococcus sp. CT_GayMR16]TFV86858.1 SARP family transcriptional regulator [Blastococcus sp. CT_GayMR16]